MRLKQIKLAGFKSFVDPTQVPFPTAMTCVVGPNGCGKSNVIDAVRWVLGESSAKNLRGDAMTDVIFNGSTQRKPVSQASVELVFENIQGRLQGSLADRHEISLKRVVTRDAQSLYFLNGTKCRRRDITDIFLGTGLGPRSYAIIEQGMISRLIESRPQDLRVFLEEAAGISKYKERRRETETRISHTRDNLLRLSDVRDELAKNIEKLRRQAATAERYKELKASERRLKAELTGLKWWYFNEQLIQSEKVLAELETELHKFQTEGSGSFKQLVELKEQQQAQRELLEQTQQQYYQLGTDITALEQQLLHQRSRRQNLQEDQRQIRQNLQLGHDQQQQEQAELEELEALLLALAPEQELIAQQQETCAASLFEVEQSQADQQSQFRTWQQQYFQLQQQQRQCQFQLQHKEQQYQQLQQQQQRVNAALAALELSDLAEQISDSAQMHQSLQQQALATEQELQSVEAQLQQLQNAQQTLTLQSQQAKLTLQMLQRDLAKQNQQLTQALAEQPLLPQLEIVKGWDTAVAVALQALNFSQVAESLPSNTLCHMLSAYTGDRPQGTLAAKVLTGPVPAYFCEIFCCNNQVEVENRQHTLGNAQSLITEDGHWRGRNWAIVASQAQRENPLHLQQRIDGIQQEIQQLEHEIAENAEQVQAVANSLNWTEVAVKALRQQLQSQQKQVQQQSTQGQLLAQQAEQQQQRQLEYQQQLTQLSEQAIAAREDIATGQLQLEELNEALLIQAEQEQHWQQGQNQGQQSVAQWRAKQQQLNQQAQQLQLQQVSLSRQLDAAKVHLHRTINQLRQQEERLAQLIAQYDLLDDPDAEMQEQLQILLLTRGELEQTKLLQQQQLQLLEQQIREVEQGQQGLQQQLSHKQKQLENARLDAEGFRVRANNMLELLTEQQVNFKEIIQNLPADATEGVWQQQLDKTSEALSRLGPINLAAIDEFAQQDERKKYLDLQHDDLVGALDTLETAIRKIDRETRQKFKQTFDEVNLGLQTLFPKVFGGGSAYLELTDEDLLETGVAIMARPPGKKNSTIHLLSGGEKALTALSLVFSIFRLNPAPFCMLDEVDAPLDDANVGRFCNLVREMSESVQFIYISHNKIAMEMAAQLMGVTMQEPGVSRVVAVDVEDAVKMAQA
ncbi:MAG: AAA family ATPase [Gammaproteobacteria bacterium]|nr:AAA family ATPase [Gammaproteobacteria bacterium]